MCVCVCVCVPSTLDAAIGRHRRRDKFNPIDGIDESVRACIQMLCQLGTRRSGSIYKRSKVDGGLHVLNRIITRNSYQTAPNESRGGEKPVQDGHRHNWEGKFESTRR